MPLRNVAAVLALLPAVAVAGGPSSPQPRLTVTQTFVGSRSYIEGSISYVRVERGDGSTLATRTLRGFPRATTSLRVPPGRFSLLSWQRPCDGNCSVLDPPTDRCRASFRVRAGRAVRAAIRVTPGQGCTVRLTTAAAH